MQARLSDWERKIVPLRRQAEIQDRWLAERFSTVLPEIMRREGFDMWIVAAREYNEDPVLLSLVPATMLSARRLTMLVIVLKPDGQLDLLNLGRYGFGAYTAAWDADKETQWEALSRLVKHYDPACIGINVSEEFAFGDGLTHAIHEQMLSALGDEYRTRTRGAERLAIGWLERRLPAEIDAYTGIVEIAHGVIAEAFSNRVVHPGITTADDVVWWIRQRINDLGLKAWFHPSVSIQRSGQRPASSVQEKVSGSTIIEPGDLLWCDVGLTYLGLCTDTQQNAYVLRIGETDAPQGLKDALAAGNRLQDIHAENMEAGRSGNVILDGILTTARSEGINAMVYTHPIGYHGHGAGPTIGLWDMQGGVPGRGEYELFADTCHSMELNIKFPVPEWGNQLVQMALEQDIVFTGGKVHYLAGRQTKLFLI